MKFFKRIAVKRILPLILVITMMFSFTFITMPKASAVAVIDDILFWVIGGIIVSSSSAMLYDGFMELINTDYKGWWEKNFTGSITKFTSLTDGKYYYCINDNFSFKSEQDKKLTQSVCDAMNVLLQKDETFRNVLETEEDGVITLQHEAYEMLVEAGIIAAANHFGKTAEGELPPVVSMDEYGNRIVTMGTERIDIGGLSFNVRDLSKYTEQEFKSKMTNTQNNSYYICPFFKANGDIYVQGSKDSNYSSGIEFISGSTTSTFKFYGELGVFFYSSGKISDGMLNLKLSGESSFVMLQDNPDAYMMLQNTNFLGYNIHFGKYFVNTRTKQKHSIDEFNNVSVRLIEFPINFRNTYGKAQVEFINNMLKTIESVPTASGQKTLAIPQTDTEDLVKRGIAAGLIPKNPSISIGKAGVISIGGVDTQTLTRTLEGTEETEKENNSKLNVTMPVIRDKFPFSLPFDVYNFFTILAKEPKTPKFTLPLSNKETGDYQRNGKWYNSSGREKTFFFDYSIDIDFKEYEIISTICRSLIFIAFLIGLAMATNKLIGRG